MKSIGLKVSFKTASRPSIPSVDKISSGSLPSGNNTILTSKPCNVSKSVHPDIDLMKHAIEKNDYQGVVDC